MHKNNKAQLTKQSETETEREGESGRLGLFNRRRRSLIAGSARDADVGTYGLTGSSQLSHKLTQFMWVHAPTAHTLAHSHTHTRRVLGSLALGTFGIAYA